MKTALKFKAYFGTKREDWESTWQIFFKFSLIRLIP